MKTPVHILRKAAVSIALGASVLIAGCGLDKSGVDPITGPSAPAEFALSVTLTATPDLLPRDGRSQSTITVFVRDELGRPVSGRRLGLGASGPVGTTLSRPDVTTGSDGKATFTVTAPDASALGGSTIVVTAVPVGSNEANAVGRSVSIGLTGLANTTAPTASFVVTPGTPPAYEVNQVLTFDASASQDEGVACASKCTYDWNFDDGGTASGRIVTHRFSAAFAYAVKLTVTDAAGLTAQASQTVTVLAVAAPAIKLEVAPESPFVNLQSVFTATATAGIGHSIVRYEWNFGDNTTATTTVPTIIKTFTDVGRFVVTVTAVDDTGQTGSAAKSVVVGFSIDPPVARFVVAPSSPRAGVQVTFNGSTSSVGVGATIVNYQWSFGDPGGIPVDTGTTPAVVFTYLTPGTYIATLTVTDSLFRQGTATVTVTVAP